MCWTLMEDAIAAPRHLIRSRVTLYRNSFSDARPRCEIASCTLCPSSAVATTMWNATSDPRAGVFHGRCRTLSRPSEMAPRRASASALTGSSGGVSVSLLPPPPHASLRCFVPENSNEHPMNALRSRRKVEDPLKIGVRHTDIPHSAGVTSSPVISIRHVSDDAVARGMVNIRKTGERTHFITIRRAQQAETLPKPPLLSPQQVTATVSPRSRNEFSQATFAPYDVLPAVTVTQAKLPILKQARSSPNDKTVTCNMQDAVADILTRAVPMSVSSTEAACDAALRELMDQLNSPGPPLPTPRNPDSAAPAAGRWHTLAEPRNRKSSPIGYTESAIHVTKYTVNVRDDTMTKADEHPRRLMRLNSDEGRFASFPPEDVANAFNETALASTSNHERRTEDPSKLPLPFHDSSRAFTRSISLDSANPHSVERFPAIDFNRSNVVGTYVAVTSSAAASPHQVTSSLATTRHTYTNVIPMVHVLRQAPQKLLINMKALPQPHVRIAASPESLEQLTGDLNEPAASGGRERHLLAEVAPPPHQINGSDDPASHCTAAKILAKPQRAKHATEGARFPCENFLRSTENELQKRRKAQEKTIVPVFKSSAPIASPAAPFASPAAPLSSPETQLSSPASPSTSPEAPLASPAAPFSSPAAPSALQAEPFSSPVAPSTSLAAPSASPTEPSVPSAAPSVSQVERPSIPQFYFPRGRRDATTESDEQVTAKVSQVFRGFPNCVAGRTDMGAVAKACGLPLFWKYPLFLATSDGTGDSVGLAQFLSTWKRLRQQAYDDAAKFVKLLAKPGSDQLVFNDFYNFVQDLVDTHPGLNFLQNAPEFHSRYIQTVISRIFFCVDRNWKGYILARDIRRSNLLATIRLLQDEDDINQITDYFSYEHFYVIYCKFWDLDSDHDLLISRDDLAKHNERTISSRMIDRIMSGTVTNGPLQRDGKMTYSDFVRFLLAEEDKKHPTSVEYWFRCMDLDGDGFITMYEMEYFYQEQVHKLEALGIETLPFEDCLCQMLDMIKPRNGCSISLRDLKSSRMATVLFDTFFNLEKYLDHEQKDPFACLHDPDEPEMSDWERFAAEEYELLVAEEGVHEGRTQSGLDGKSDDEAEEAIRPILLEKNSVRLPGHELSLLKICEAGGDGGMTTIN